MLTYGRCAVAGCAAVVGLCGLAHADVNYGFTNVTTNGGAAFASSHNSMFSLNVAEAGVSGGGNVLADFTFTIDVSARPSSITDTYFYDGHILGLAGIASSAGVSFGEGASPGQLPGYSGGGASRLFSADSNPPAGPNGVNANNEWLTITFELFSGATFQNLIDDLNSGAVVVGIHVQQQLNGQSNSYTTPVLIPLPPSALAGTALLGALGAIGWVRRRRA